MDKGVWKLLTAIGFLVAVLAAGAVAVFRFQVLDRLGISFFTLNRNNLETQQMFFVPSQQGTQQTDDADLNADRQNFSRMMQGCFSGNDCVPSIDEPQFVPAIKAKFVNDDDLVVGVTYQADSKSKIVAKAYPLKILNWHEAVNDFLGDKPIVVTYCPLSMTPRVFDRDVDGKTALFGISGEMLNSDTVLYDRETKSLWNQFDGEALTGPLRNHKLSSLPLQFVRWADWLKQHPSTLVLTGNPVSGFKYDQSPYPDYEKNPDIYFPLENSDSRRKPKEMVFGIVSDGRTKVYPQSELAKAFSKQGSLDDDFAGVKLRLSYARNMLNITDAQTHREIPVDISYYFVWEAFYPNSDIFQAPSAS